SARFRFMSSYFLSAPPMMICGIKTSSQHCPASLNSADHHGRRAHQIRGHEPEPRAALCAFTLVFRTSQYGEKQEDGEQAAGAVCLSIRRYALVVRRDGSGAG